MDRRMSNWADLPTDILEMVAKLLKTRLDDTRRFRSVCRSFRSSAPPPSKIRPSIKVPPPFQLGPSYCDHLLLTESTIYAVEPLDKTPIPPTVSKTWLIKIQELDSGNFLFKDPFHNHSWRWEELSHKLPKSINILDYSVREITKVQGIDLVAVGDTDTQSCESNHRIIHFEKVVASKCLDAICDEFTVMAIFKGCHGQDNYLGMWRYGDDKWTELPRSGGTEMLSYWDDIVYYNENFYAVGSSGYAISVDPKSLKVTEMKRLPTGPAIRFLVKTDKGLFLVQRELNLQLSDCSVNIFLLDEEMEEWIKVTDGLEDREWFLGVDCSYSITSGEFSGFSRNFVFIAYGGRHDVRFSSPGEDIGIINLDDKFGRLRIYLPYHLMKFWPPPGWVGIPF